MAPAVRAIAGDSRPGLKLALIHLLRWPDWALPDRFVTGFGVVGLIQASNLYPRVEVQAAALAEDLTGGDADAWNNAQAQDSR
eukprot:10893623-Alexandrium_andersonii.AAC.1